MGLRKRILPSRYSLILCLSALSLAVSAVLQSCHFPFASPSLPAPSSPSPTAFQPLTVTPTPEPLNVWISPAVPMGLRERIDGAVRTNAASIRISDEADAQLKIQANAEFRPVEWIYALAAPFPTLQDGVAGTDLQAIWAGSGDFEGKIYASNTTLMAFEGLFGAADEAKVVGVSPQTLADVAWADRPAYAIVPFDELEPRWKVLEVDEKSPIRNDFDGDNYLLRVSFGLSGSSQAIEQFLRLVDWPATNRDPARMTILAMTGVTALTRGTAARMDSHGVDYPGLLIGDWLRDADLTHVSNEVSFAESCPTPDPLTADRRFCSAPKNIALLVDVGVDLVELTGNHVNDWGEDALLYTLDLYQARNWQTFGGGRNLDEALRAVTIDHNGNHLAFLGCNAAGPAHAWATEDSPGAAPCDTETLYAEIERLRSDGYLVVFTFQWFEGASLLPPQRDAFREAVDAGANIVSGSQAHQPLGFEFYNGGFIHYGLGNLFFDQMQSLALRQEFIDFYVVYDGRHISTELRTALLEDYAQPRPMTAEERLAFLADIFARSLW
ncbi:MAG: CapA family protein [Anaerolineales bacterium]